MSVIVAIIAIAGLPLACYARYRRNRHSTEAQDVNSHNGYIQPPSAEVHVQNAPVHTHSQYYPLQTSVYQPMQVPPPPSGMYIEPFRQSEVNPFDAGGKYAPSAP